MKQLSIIHHIKSGKLSKNIEIDCQKVQVKIFTKRLDSKLFEYITGKLELCNIYTPSLRGVENKKNNFSHTSLIKRPRIN